MKKKILIGLIITLGFLYLYGEEQYLAQLLEEGITLHEAGDFEGALERYNRIIELDENNIMAYYEKAYALYSLQRYPEAMECIIKVMESDDFKVQAHMLYGSLLDVTGKTEESIIFYTKSIKEFPENYLLRYNLGLSYFNIKDYHSAENNFIEALKLNPGHLSSLYGLLFAEYYQEKKMETIVTALFFLFYEQETERARIVQKILIEAYARNISVDNGNINMNINPGKPYSQLSTLETAINLSFSGALLQVQNNELEESALFISTNALTLELLLSLKKFKFKNKFWYAYFIAPLKEIEKKKLSVQFTAYINNIFSPDKVTYDQLKNSDVYAKIYTILTEVKTN